MVRRTTRTVTLASPLLDALLERTGTFSRSALVYALLSDLATGVYRPRWSTPPQRPQGEWDLQPRAERLTRHPTTAARQSSGKVRFALSDAEHADVQACVRGGVPMAARRVIEDFVSGAYRPSWYA